VAICSGTSRNITTHVLNTQLFELYNK